MSLDDSKVAVRSLREHGSRPLRFTQRFILVLGIAAGLAEGFAATPVTGGDGSGRRAAGDGRGLTTFGDRGLTTFGDRFGQSFANRGLESFGDIPLTPMGGLIVGRDGDDDSRTRRSTSSSRRRDCRERFGPLFHFVSSRSGGSEATLRADFGPDFGWSDGSLSGSTLLMPAVELPAVTFDHRPAADLLDATLAAAARRALEDGDLDLARSLDPDRR